MGYDIYSVETDALKAEAFARNHPDGYSLAIKKETDEYLGGPQVYFRANVWAMNLLRHIHEAIGGEMEALNEHLVWNDGQELTPAMINKALHVADSLTVKEVAQAVMLAMMAEKDLLPVDRVLSIYADEAEIEELANRYLDQESVMNLASFYLYWTQYLGIVKDLGGAEVW